MIIDNLKRRLDRLKAQQATLEEHHAGRELQFTYWGGYSLGYIKGKIAELEDFIDDIDEGKLICK